MKIKNINNMKLGRVEKISVSDTSDVYRLGNGSVLKLFQPEVIMLSKLVGVDIEGKILAAKPIKSSPEILVPTSAIYDDSRNFIGYTMPMAKGVDYNKIEENLTYSQREDLGRYGRIHNKLESIIKKNQNIVFPDFCTCDNIFIDDKENIKFIDYDGLQVDKFKSLSTSTSLGDFNSYNNSKYIDNSGLFTKELDKKSLIILYFLSAFNINLNRVGSRIPGTSVDVTLDMVFEYINLDDPDICHKVWKLFNDKENNEYLGDDVFNLADKYEMKIVAKQGPMYSKKLYRK